MHPYFVERQAQQHQDALHRLATSVKSPPRRTRRRIGAGLVSLGEWVAGASAARAPRRSGCPPLLACSISE